ncbi:unnamed protein product [Penicillium salamii]|nr:unnamed protein product [Penicillium salamii]CAG8399170.1 unnamed protein product [Penicillium salamii]
MGNRESSYDYDDDMHRAKEVGIDAFALNIGVDHYTDTQLTYAYESAARCGMHVFLSFDFNIWDEGQTAAIGAKIRQYANFSSQLRIDDKIFVSSFAGDAVDVDAIQAAADGGLFFAPNFHPGHGNFSAIQSVLNWMAWPNNGNNKAPTPGHNITVREGDEQYIASLAGKPYIARELLIPNSDVLPTDFTAVSPWFSTHFGSDVPYSKNWVFPSDLLWYNRWQEILSIGPRFVEILTWNDYGESSYIGPLSSPHTDDGASKWVLDMPHNGWREMMRPFIAAYKDGALSANSYVTDEALIYWYRLTPRSINCDQTDTTIEGGSNNSSGSFFRGRPNGWEQMKDSVFAVSLLKYPADIRISSGNSSKTFQAPAGISAYSVPMGVGPQKFTVSRQNKHVMSGMSAKNIVDHCICGIYNFNAYVGMLPAPTTIDSLQPAGAAMLSQGLRSACDSSLSTVLSGQRLMK